jgi:hypothetical protein
MALPQFPHTRVMAHPAWSNYTGTISGRGIPVFCSLEGGADVSIMKKHGDAIRAIVRHCFREDPPQKLRVVGSAWSFSSVIEPDKVALDPSAMTFRHRVTPDQLSAEYAPRAAEGYVPYYFQGGTGIASINERLGRDGLALQTSGGGNGHRIGGCIATGTHGSALGIGALHDTVLALHLVTGPDTAVLVQPGTNAPFTPALAAWLEQVTGIPTRDVADDQQFHAAQVSLGSLGVVFGVIVEATPLYHFRIKRVRSKITSDVMWNAIRTLDTSALHPGVAAKPYHFDVIVHPYPDLDRDMMFATMMWKEDPAGIPFRNPLPGIPRVSSDTMGLISRFTMLNNLLLGPLVRQVLQTQVLEQLRGDHMPIDKDHAARRRGREHRDRGRPPEHRAGAQDRPARARRASKQRPRVPRRGRGTLHPQDQGAAWHEPSADELLHRAPQCPQRQRRADLQSDLDRARQEGCPFHLPLGPDGRLQARAGPQLLRRQRCRLDRRPQTAPERR